MSPEDQRVWEEDAETEYAEAHAHARPATHSPADAEKVSQDVGEVERARVATPESAERLNRYMDDMVTAPGLRPVFSESGCPRCGSTRMKVTPSGRTYCIPCRHAHEKRRKQGPLRCRDCGAAWIPVRRGECVRCGSDAGPVLDTPEPASPDTASEGGEHGFALVLERVAERIQNPNLLNRLDQIVARTGAQS